MYEQQKYEAMEEDDATLSRALENLYQAISVDKRGFKLRFIPTQKLPKTHCKNEKKNGKKNAILKNRINACLRDHQLYH